MHTATTISSSICTSPVKQQHYQIEYRASEHESVHSWILQTFASVRRLILAEYIIHLRVFCGRLLCLRQRVSCDALWAFLPLPRGCNHDTQVARDYCYAEMNILWQTCGKCRRANMTKLRSVITKHDFTIFQNVFILLV